MISPNKAYNLGVQLGLMRKEADLADLYNDTKRSIGGAVSGLGDKLSKLIPSGKSIENTAKYLGVDRLSELPKDIGTMISGNSNTNYVEKAKEQANKAQISVEDRLKLVEKQLANKTGEGLQNMGLGAGGTYAAIKFGPTIAKGIQSIAPKATATAGKVALKVLPALAKYSPHVAAGAAGVAGGALTGIHGNPILESIGKNVPGAGILDNGGKTQAGGNAKKSITYNPDGSVRSMSYAPMKEQPWSIRVSDWLDRNIL
jgi:hypothetical protein